MLRSKSEKDGRFCRERKGKRTEVKREMPEAGQSSKGRGGRKRKIQTEGYFYPNQPCEYYGIGAELIHALLEYGTDGTQEVIQDVRRQTCGKQFTVRWNTIQYRLKNHSVLNVKILWLLALDVDAFTLEDGAVTVGTEAVIFAVD